MLERRETKENNKRGAHFVVRYPFTDPMVHMIVTQCISDRIMYYLSFKQWDNGVDIASKV